MAQGDHQAPSCSHVTTRAVLAWAVFSMHLLPLFTPALRLKGVPYVACQGSVWLGRVTHCMLVAWLCVLFAILSPG